MKSARALLLAGGAGAFGSLDTSLNIAFPDLVDDLGIEVAQLQWVIVSFVLTYGGLLLAAGQLGDRLGHQRMMTIGAAGSVVAMAGCAVAGSLEVLVAARVFQGMTTGLVMAAGPAMASRVAGGGERGAAIGVFQLSAGVGAAVGPLVGAPLVSWAGWPAVFWYRVPLSAGLLLLALGASAGDEPTTSHNDTRGAFLTAGGMAAGLLVVTSGRELGLTSPLLWTATTVAVFLGWSYVRHWKRAEFTIIDLALFRRASFAIANGLNLVSNGAMFVAFLLLPTLLLDEMELSTFGGGLALAASPAMLAALSPWAGRWADRRGPATPVIAGLAVEAVGLLLLSRLGAGSSMWAAVGAMAVVGTGLGLFASPNMAMVMSRLPDERQGVAGGLSLLTRTAGIVVGVAAWSAMFDALEPGRGFVDAFQITTLVAAVTAAAGAALAWATTRLG